MFRIDSEHVVDATRNGGLARYDDISLIYLVISISSVLIFVLM